MATKLSRKKNRKAVAQAHLHRVVRGAFLWLVCTVGIYGLEVERIIEYSNYHYADSEDPASQSSSAVIPPDSLISSSVRAAPLPSLVSADPLPSDQPTPHASPTASPTSKPTPVSKKIATPSAKPVPTSSPTPATSASADQQHSILDFGPDMVIHGAGTVEESNSPLWWINEGGDITVQNGGAATMQGPAPIGSYWQVFYGKDHPDTTDQGLYPQDLIRLISRSNWQNVRQTSYFQIKADHFLNVSTRNGSNGLLFFSRYVDQYNLYYSGLRVDGYVVIKKKIAGNYYTMATKKIIDGPAYDPVNNPTLLPKDQWLGLRSETVNNPDGTVTVTLYTDLNRQGNWTKALQVTDDGKTFGGAPFTQSGFVGIRTDFMDVLFDQYRAEAL